MRDEDGVRAFLSRPLVFLLPFFIVGLSLGPRTVSLLPFLWPAAACAALFFLWWVVRGWPWPWCLAAAALTLTGLAASSAVFQPPRAPNHVSLYRDRPGLLLGGRVSEGPLPSYDLQRFVVVAQEALSGGRPFPVSGRVLLTFPAKPRDIRMGDWVRFPAALRPIHGFANPGGFDRSVYWAARGVRDQVFIKNGRLATVLQPVGGRLSILAAIDRFRERSARFVEGVMGQPARGLALTMLLGLRQEIDPEVNQAFQRLGLTHLLSISGMHLGLVALASFGLVRYLILLWPGLALRLSPLRAASLISLAPITGYALLAGLEPATVRSAIMAAVFCLAFFIGRRPDTLSALAAAAWIILAFQPGALFSISFQLTFAATAALLLAASRVFLVPDPPGEGSARAGGWSAVFTRLTGPAVISTAAFLGTAPIVAYYFNRLPLLTLPANLIFAPLITLIVVPPGLIAVLLAPVFPLAAKGILLVMERLLWCCLATLEGAAARPGIEWIVPSPGPVFLAGYYLFFGALFLVRGRKKAALLVLAGVLAVGLTLVLGPVLSRAARPRLSVTFLDVGQGNAAHVSFPDGRHMIVDGGGFPGSDFDPGRHLIAPYLSHEGVRRVQILVLSHAHLDHYLGLSWLAGHYKPEEFWWSGEFDPALPPTELLAALERPDLKRPPLSALFEPRRFGAALVQVLYPRPGPVAWTAGESRDATLNNRSLVLRLQMGKRVFLLPGDLERDGEAALVSRYGEALRADVLLACHHGGATSLTPAFLQAVRPAHVVFSVGVSPRLGFPSQAALARVRLFGARIYRTDQDGAVRFITDGEGLTVQPTRRSGAEPLVEPQ
jgi:competence protein ComEC